MALRPLDHRITTVEAAREKTLAKMEQAQRAIDAWTALRAQWEQKAAEQEQTLAELRARRAAEAAPPPPPTAEQQRPEQAQPAQGALLQLLQVIQNGDQQQIQEVAKRVAEAIKAPSSQPSRGLKRAPSTSEPPTDSQRPKAATPSVPIVVHDAPISQEALAAGLEAILGTS